MTTNGNGKWILGAAASVAVFTAGLVIGWQASTIDAADRYVTRSEYNRDKDDLRDDLKEINKKLDALLRSNQE